MSCAICGAMHVEGSTCACRVVCHVLYAVPCISKRARVLVGLNKFWLPYRATVAQSPGCGHTRGATLSSLGNDGFIDGRTKAGY